MRKLGHEIFDAVNFRMLRALRFFDEGVYASEVAMLIAEPQRAVIHALHSARDAGYVAQHGRMRSSLWTLTGAGRAHVRSIVARYQAQVDLDIAEQEAA